MSTGIDTDADPAGELPAPGLPPTGRLVRSSLAVASGTALSRLTGLVRVAVLAAVLGRTALADAFLLANNTPNIVYELILGGILSATLVPLFVEAGEHHDDDGPAAVFSTAVVSLVGLTVLAMVAAPFVVRLYALRLPDAAADAQAELAVVLLWLFLPQIAFYGLTAVWTAMLHARRRFVAAAYAPVLNNLVVIAALVAFDAAAEGGRPSLEAVRHDRLLVALLGLGTTLGVVVMTLALLPSLRRGGWRLRWLPSWRHPMVRAVVRLSGWTVGYVAANQVALFVVLALANSRGGNVAAYQFAFIFFQLPHGLVAVSVMTTFAPDLASAAVAQRWEAFKERFAAGALLVTGLLLPAAVGFVLLGHDLVATLLERGSFGPADSAVTGDVLRWFAVGLPGFSLYLFTLRAFYARRDTRTPFFLNVVENGINVVLAVVLVGRYGVEGLAAAYGIAYTVGAVLALAALRRRVGHLVTPGLVAGAGRVVVATAAMAAAVAWLVDRFGADVRGRELAVAVAAGAAVYGAALLALWPAAAARLVALGRRRGEPPTRH